MVEMDASKEFEGNVRTGFGIDGFQDEDFDAVRGNFKNNSFKHQLDDMRIQVAKDLEHSLSILKKL